MNPQCSEAVELETHWDCPNCGAAVRRRVDCRHYQPTRSFCLVTRGEIDLPQARDPGKLSVSYACRLYEHQPMARA